MFTTRDTPRGKVLSAGYPAVEELIDSEQFEPLNQVFTTAYEQLDQLAKAKGGLKTRKEAKKAMKSIEVVMDLLRELLAIKYRLQELPIEKK